MSLQVYGSMRYCLDTTFLVDFLTGRTEAIKKYKEIRNSSIEVTPIIAWELLTIAKKIGNEEYMVAMRLLERLKMNSPTLTSSKIAADIENKVGKLGVSKIHILNVAVIIENDLTLVTRNEEYIKIRDALDEFKVELYR